MYSYYDNKLERSVRVLYIGEYCASGAEEYLSTVLGSCIAVALFDQNLRIGGLNHFMLPRGAPTQEEGSDGRYFSGPGRYGMAAMEYLINELLKLGSRREALTAKVFGGGQVLHFSRSGGSDEANVAEKNINFAFTYLKTEGIPMVASDVGGTIARKIYYNPRSSEILLKRITGSALNRVEQEEENYLDSLSRKGRQEGQATFF